MRIDIHPITTERLAERRGEIAAAARGGKLTLIGALPEIEREAARERR